MKRFLTTALILGVISPFSLVGCADKAKVEQSEKVEGPGGTTTTTETKEIKSTGENPPLNSAGENAATPK